jgi:uncharacterized protein
VPFSFYDAVVPSYLQILGSVDFLIDKAKTFCAESNRSEADIIDARLIADMAPFGYQVKACAEHSAGAIEGVRSGRFTPSTAPWPTTLAGLHGLVADAIATLQGEDRTAFETLATAETWFVFRERKLPFTGANFLLSFSQPNFYFHATTAYDILRAEGVKIGKRDFLGALRQDQSAWRMGS